MGFLFGAGGAGSQVARLSGIQVQETGYGNVIKIVYGTNKTTAMLIWADGFFSEKVDSGGGKGGGGKSGGASYRYYSDIILAVCEGTILDFGTVWRDKQSFQYNDKGFTTHRTGSATQDVWPYLTSKYPLAALNYRGIAYVAATKYRLRDGAVMGNHSMQVKGIGVSPTPGQQNTLDAHIQTIINDFITNPRYGAVSADSYSFTIESAQMHAYCSARSLLISPVLAEQKEASAYLEEWLVIANAAMVWSEGVLKLLPYADSAYSSSFGTYTPEKTIRAHFDSTNIGTLIKPIRKNPADCFNSVKIDCTNRGQDYAKHTQEVKDDTSIRLDGNRPAPKVTMESITTPRVANIVGRTQLHRGLYIRNSYQIDCFCDNGNDLLEPLDFVTITEPDIGLNSLRCRIVSIDDTMLDGSDGANMSILVEEATAGAYNG